MFISVQDICGIICAVLTWLLILYAEFVVMAVIIIPNPYPVYSTFNMILFNLFAFMAFSSHMRTMFSDPVRIDQFLQAFQSHFNVWSSGRELFRKVMQQKKWSSNWDLRKAKYFSNALNAAVLSQSAPIIVPFANVASAKWITIAHGEYYPSFYVILRSKSIQIYTYFLDGLEVSYYSKTLFKRTDSSQLIRICLEILIPESC